MTEEIEIFLWLPPTSKYLSNPHLLLNQRAELLTNDRCLTSQISGKESNHPKRTEVSKNPDESRGTYEYFPIPFYFTGFQRILSVCLLRMAMLGKGSKPYEMLQREAGFPSPRSRARRLLWESPGVSGAAGEPRRVPPEAGTVFFALTLPC